MSSKITIIKRDGRKEDLNLDKIHKVVFWATEGLSGVSASELEIKTQLQFYNNMKTVDIQETLIKAAADLISEESPNYQYVAGRLINYALRKEVYNNYQPITLFEIVKKNIELKYYTPELLTWYDENDWTRLDSFIKHDRDMDLTYVAMEQMRGKYLIQNRVTGQILETPQVAYILIAATLFHKYPKETRMQWIRDYYEAISTHDVSLPTPIMAGVRSPQRQFSSCVLIETDDSLDSINATTSAIVKYVSQKAGIGIGAGRIRPIGFPVRNGDTSHTGVIPFYKMFQSAVRSCCLDKNTWVEVVKDENLYSIMLTEMIQLKELKPGMLIKSYEAGRVVYKNVVEVWNTKVKKSDRLVLEFTNGTKLRCSSNHPIMVLVDNEVEQRLPNALTEFDEIITDNGSCYLYSITEDIEEIEYIDIEVEDTHTFFASLLKNDKMILTHNSQGGVRNGAATLYYPIWHYEIEDLLVLKNNKGTDDNRVRHMDYGVQFNKLFYQRLIEGGDISLFSPNDVPEMYDAFFNDQEKFSDLYEKAESNPKIRKKKVKAIDLFSSFVKERKDTGRIYLMNVDNANMHSSFDESMAPIRQSNLCCVTGDTKVSALINDELREQLTIKDLTELWNNDTKDIKVLSKNITSNEIRYESISAAALTRHDAELIEIEDTDNKVKLVCTPDHLIFTKNRGYVRADELTENDILDIV